MRDDPVQLFQKLDAEIANFKSHPPEPKSKEETEKQLEYATMSKNPPIISVDYAGIDSSSEQKTEKQLTATNEYSTFNGYPPNVGDAYAVDESKSPYNYEKQFTLTEDTTTVGKDISNEAEEPLITVTLDQACPLETNKALAENSIGVLELTAVSAESNQQELEQKKARSSDIGWIDNESHDIDVTTGKAKDITATNQADERKREPIQKLKRKHGKPKSGPKLENQPIFEPMTGKSPKIQERLLDLAESDLKNTLENAPVHVVPDQMENEVCRADSNQKRYLEEENRQQRAPKMKIKQQNPPKVINKQPQTLIVGGTQQQALKEENKRQHALEVKNKQHQNPKVQNKQPPVPKEETKQQKAPTEVEKEQQQSTEKETTKHQAINAKSKQQKRIKSKKKQSQNPEEENEQQQFPTVMKKQQHDENKPAVVYNSKEAWTDKSIDDTLPADPLGGTLEDSNTVEENAAHITIQSITIQTKNITKRKPEKSVETKRYLRVFRLLSSALGYSWAYRDVWRKKKQFQLQVDGEDSVEEPIAQHNQNEREPKRKLNESEKYPERLAKCESARVITSARGSHTEHKHKTTNNDDNQRNTAIILGSSRVHPYYKHEQTVTRKGTPSNKHKTHWTDSKF